MERFSIFKKIKLFGFVWLKKKKRSIWPQILSGTWACADLPAPEASQALRILSVHQQACPVLLSLGLRHLSSFSVAETQR